MKKTLFLFVCLLFTVALVAQESSIYDYKIKDVDGKLFDFADLKGKKIMIVNTASQCRHTQQIQDLQTLYADYGGEDFVVIAFPSADFLGQEPLVNPEIKLFCERKYGVTFPIMAKSNVKGKYINPVYGYLTSYDLNGVTDRDVVWNFQKYLINENGMIERVLSPGHSPLAPDVIAWVEED